MPSTVVGGEMMTTFSLRYLLTASAMALANCSCCDKSNFRTFGSASRAWSSSIIYCVRMIDIDYPCKEILPLMLDDINDTQYLSVTAAAVRPNLVQRSLMPSLISELT